MARRFLGGLLETKARVKPAEAVLRSGGAAIGNAGMPLGSPGTWDIEKGVKDGMERVGHVFRCVDVIAQNQARIPMEIVKVAPGIKRSAAETVDDPDIWSLLNFRPNKYESATAFRYRLSATLLLSRRGAFIEMVKGGNGKVVELHLMAPGRVNPIPDAKNFVSGYEITRGDYVTDIVPAENVMWVKTKPHPMDPYQQMTPLMASGLAVETEYLARIFNRNFLANDGRPGMLVTVQGRLSEEDAEELKRRFSGGVAQAGETSVIEGDGIQSVDMSANPRDVQWAEMLRGTKEDILLAFGVPESVMGNASGRTFDNADAERENFWIDTMQPHCDAIAMGLDDITGDRNDNNVVAYDYSTVDVLQRVERVRREELRGEVAAGLRTIDEYFEETGREKWDVVGTRILYHTSGIAIAKNPEDQGAITTLKPVGQPAAPDASESARQGALKGVAVGQRQLGNQMAAQGVRARALSLVAGAQKSEAKDRETKTADDKEDHTVVEGEVVVTCPYEAERKAVESGLEGRLEMHDSRMEEVIADRLHHAKFRKGTRHWDDETKKFPKSQKCKYCRDEATKRIIHSEGMAYVPVCDEHLSKGKDAAARCTPDKSVDPSNIDRIIDAKSALEQEAYLEAFVRNEIKALDPKYAVEIDKWVAELDKGTSAFIRKVMIREARTAARDMKNSGIDEIMKAQGKAWTGDSDPLRSLLGGTRGVDSVLDPIFSAIMSILKTAARNQGQRVMDRITEMDANGSSIRDIEKEVRKLIGKRGQWRKNISINLTTTAAEAARFEVYKRAGNLYDKVWVSEEDARVRPSHVAAHGQTRAAHKPFRVGGAAMQFPADPKGPVHETANCRCWLDWNPSDEYYKIADRMGL